MMKYISLSVFLLFSTATFTVDTAVLLALMSNGEVTYDGTMRINADDGKQYEVTHFNFNKRGCDVTYYNGQQEVTVRFLCKG